MTNVSAPIETIASRRPPPIAEKLSANVLPRISPEVLGLWRDFVLRLSSTPVVSIAKIRGRTRGIGNEFVLACDMRFASRQSALFGQPEIGTGLVPGGGALEWLRAWLDARARDRAQQRRFRC